MSAYLVLGIKLELNPFSNFEDVVLLQYFLPNFKILLQPIFNLQLKVPHENCCSRYNRN
jgi:hypothetical protein